MNRKDEREVDDFIAMLHGVVIPRCQHCLHPIANHHGDEGCTSISSVHSDGDDVLPCGCGKMDDVPLQTEKAPLRGVCSRCGEMLHDSDATICELCRGHRGEPYPEDG